MAYPWTALFTDIGKIIKVSNDIEALNTLLATDRTEVEGVFDDDSDDIAFMATLISSIGSMEGSVNGGVSSFTSRQQSYLTGIGKSKIDSTYSSVADIIDDIVAKMVDESQIVDGNPVSFFPDAYTEAGDNNNQLSDDEDIRGVTSANMDATFKMYFSVVDEGGGNFHTNIYNDTARGAGDLIGHTGSYNGAGTEAITDDNASGLCGTITIDAATAADVDIIVTWTFGGTRTGNGVMSNFSCSEMANDDDIRLECVAAGVSGSEQWSIYSSEEGQGGFRATTGVAFPAAGQTDEFGINFLINDGGVDFIVGDVFLIKTYSTDDGTFQSYFRDKLGKILPSVLDGSETVNDNLAE